MSRWEAYLSKIKTKSAQTPDMNDIAKLFPFQQYFSNAPQPIFKGRTYEEDMEIAEGCFRHIKKIFTQLEVSYTRPMHSWEVQIVQRRTISARFVFSLPIRQSFNGNHSVDSMFGPQHICQDCWAGFCTYSYAVCIRAVAPEDARSIPICMHSRSVLLWEYTLHIMAYILKGYMTRFVRWKITFNNLATLVFLCIVCKKTSSVLLLHFCVFWVCWGVS